MSVPLLGAYAPPEDQRDGHPEHLGKWACRAMVGAPFEDETIPMANNPTCPDCKVGDLIKISMTVGGRDLAFATCHHCEAKWWFREGEEVPLSSVIGLVVQK
jgi:hypothetical protein